MVILFLSLQAMAMNDFGIAGYEKHVSRIKNARAVHDNRKIISIPIQQKNTLKVSAIKPKSAYPLVLESYQRILACKAKSKDYDNIKKYTGVTISYRDRGVLQECHKQNLQLTSLLKQPELSFSRIENWLERRKPAPKELPSEDDIVKIPLKFFINGNINMDSPVESPKESNSAEEEQSLPLSYSKDSELSMWNGEFSDRSHKESDDEVINNEVINNKVINNEVINNKVINNKVIKEEPEENDSDSESRHSPPPLSLMALLNQNIQNFSNNNLLFKKPVKKASFFAKVPSSDLSLLDRVEQEHSDSEENKKNREFKVHQNFIQNSKFSPKEIQNSTTLQKIFQKAAELGVRNDI